MFFKNDKGFSIRKRIDFFVAAPKSNFAALFSGFSIRKRIDFFVALKICLINASELDVSVSANGSIFL